MAEPEATLSERELEILRLVATGASNYQIARQLVISPNTVKVHLRNIFEKLGVQSRTEATMLAVQRGWIAVVPPAVSAERATPVQAPPARPLSLPEPLPRWQRFYLACAALLSLFIFLLPYTGLGPFGGRPRTALSDTGGPPAAPPQPLAASGWTPRTALPTARARLALAAVGEKIYAIAGETAKGPTNVVEVYDLPSNGWLPVTPKPLAVSNVAGATLGGRVYIPGGLLADGSLTDVVEVFDPATGVWTRAASLPQPLCCYALVVLGERLYLFGGWDGTAYVATALAYDPASDAWHVLSPMPTARGFAAAATLDGRIYVVGGYDGRRELSVNEMYDPALEGTSSGPWAARAPLLTARGGLGLAAAGSALFAVGGGWTGMLAANERYDPATDAWSTFDSPLLGQWRGLGVVSTNGKVFAVGGYSGTYLNLVQEYQAVFRVIVPVGG
jgi:DNA-binding CsgD family transcriptional regulator